MGRNRASNVFGGARICLALISLVISPTFRETENKTDFGV